jgi:hypothetical protein
MHRHEFMKYAFALATGDEYAVVLPMEIETDSKKDQ